MIIKKIVFSILSIFLILGCNKEKRAAKDGFTEAPVLTMESVTPLVAKEFKDSIIIIVKYKDLTGDLGRENPDDNALYIKDRRLPDADYFHIPPLVGNEGENRFSGTFRIKVPSLFLVGNGADEKTDLRIKVKDFAGNWSNEVATPEIIIIR